MGFLVDAVGSVLGDNAQATAGQKSVSDFQNAVQWSNQASQNAFNNEVANYQPIYNTGLNALNGASAMLQPGYNFSTSDPSYQWRLNQGLAGVNSNAAANGLLQSGGTLKALNNYAQGAASQEFQNQFNRQNTLAGYLPAAASGIANANQNYANNQQKAYFDGAQGMYQGRTDQGNATAKEYGGISSGIDSVGKFFGF